MTKTYDIWMEGYWVTGMEDRPAPASKLASNVEASNFAEACRNYCSKLDPAKHGTFDPENLTLWGCGLFPNEHEARLSFG